MKTIKNIGKLLVNNFLFLLILVLIFSINLRIVINKNLINKIVVKKVSDSATTLIDKNFKDMIKKEDYNKIKKEIENNKSVNNVIEKYADNTINSIITNNVKDVKVTDDIKKIIKENKSDIEKEYNITINEEDVNKAIDEFDQNYKINDYYKKTVKSASSSLTDEQKEFLKIYKTITTIEFILIIGALVIVMTVIVALYQKSFYKWLKNVSISGIIASIIVGIVFVILSLYINKVIDGVSLKTINSILVPIFSFDISMVLLITYIIINRKKKNATS